MWIKKHLEREWFTIFATPALLWQSLFLLIPLSALLFFSFLEETPSGWMLSLIHYKTIFKPIYITAITSSLIFSFVTTALCIVIAYPIAYFIAFIVKKGQSFLLMLLVMPSWTNIITQIYAWFVLLQKNGVVSSAIAALHITNSPMHLLNNKPVIIMGLVYCFLPFMVLPIYLSLLSIKKNLIEASADLGATDMQTFWRIILPLSHGGLINGILLVAVPAFGEYAAIEILGGANYALWGGNIVNSYLVAKNYSEGAALTIVGISSLISSLAAGFIMYKFVTFAYTNVSEKTIPARTNTDEEGIF